MMDSIQSLPIPRVDTAQVRQWFGGVKEFPDIELLMQIVSQGAPVHVSGQGDLQAALAYGNHRSSCPFSPHIMEKIVEDVSMGRAFVFPRKVAEQIPGIRISPLTVAESTSKIRICHDLTNARSGSSVNEDTDTSFYPEFKIGHVLRSVVWGILFLYSKFVVGQADPPRILLAKQDTKSAFRQVSVQINRSPVFGYVFEDLVVVDRYLQFGWTSSPSAWGVCASAVEHAHKSTTVRDAVITPEGRAVTSHVQVISPRENEVPGKPPLNCAYPQDSGGGFLDPLWVSTFVDDALFVEMEHKLRCLMASQSFASDSFRLFGTRNNGEPPLFAAKKITSWDTRMEMLGWSIDTVAMTIAVPHEKVVQLHVLLEGWPSDRREASVKEVRSLFGETTAPVGSCKAGEVLRA